MIQDLELITAFMEKSLKKENVGTRSNHLKAHTICNNNQLLAKDEGIVAAIHLSQDPLCFMVKLRSLYWELINKMLMDKNFIPLESKSGIDFYRYQHCEIPQAYEIYCTNPIQLWRKWWVKSRNKKKNIFALDFLIRTRNSWYPIQDIVVEERTIYVKTLGSVIPLTEADIVIWLQKAVNQPQAIKSPNISPVPTPTPPAPTKPLPPPKPQPPNIVQTRFTANATLNQARIQTYKQKLKALSRP